MTQFENSPERVYNPDMSPTVKRKIEFNMLAAIGYIVILAVAILGIQSFDNAFQRVVSLVLLLSFTILFTLMPDRGAPVWKLHLTMGVLTAIVIALIAMRPNWGIFQMLFFVLSPAAMMLFPQRTGMKWIGVFTLSTLLTLLIFSSVVDALMMALPYAAGYWFFGVFARALAAAEEARAESQRLLAELRSTHHQLQDYAAQVEELAVAEERNRLSREMHDTLGHRLTVAAVQLEGAQRLIPRDPERAATIVGTVREQVREALSELRSAVATLRDPLETDLPISVAIQRLAKSFEEATNFVVHLDLQSEQPVLSNAQRLALYRAAQEALTNVQRHSQAQQVWVQLHSQENCITLAVHDDGVGFLGETKETAFGLHGMRERAAHLDGELQLTTRPEGGAQVKFILPLKEESEDDGNDSTATCR